MTSLSLATVEDIPNILEAFDDMHTETSYKHIELSPSKIGYTLAQIIEGEQMDGVVVLCRDEGSIKGVLITTTMNYSFSDDKVAAELMFWVKEGSRHSVALSLWKAWEYWSDNCGAHRKQMSLLTSKRPRRFSKFLKNNGYIKTEESYLKEIIR
jgi:hypothetical protein